MPDQPQQNPNLPPSYYFEEDTTSPIDILVFIARHLIVILITPTITCVIVIIYVTFFAQPVYLSTSKIISSSNSNNTLSQMGGLAAQFGVNLSTDQSNVNWVYEDIIKSRTLARKIIKRKFDTNKYGPQKTLLQILTYGNEDPRYSLDTLEILAVDELLSMINIEDNIQTKIYSISINASEPKLACDLNMAIIEELGQHQRAYNKTKTSETRLFIEDRIAEIQKELQTVEETLKNFRDRNRRIENSPSLQLQQQRLSREVTMLSQVFTTLKQQLETAKIEEVKESDYVIILDPPEIPIYRFKPKKKLSVILAGFFGIGLGVLIGAIKEYLYNNKENLKKIDSIKKLALKNIRLLIPIRNLPK